MALVDSLDTDPATREQIRELVEHKNFPALDLLLERFEGCPAQKALKKLPALFGSSRSSRRHAPSSPTRRRTALLTRWRISTTPFPPSDWIT